MSRQSFTLREDFPEGGSYLQFYPTTYSASSAAASATYLRGDNVQIATKTDILDGLQFFEGYASDYGVYYTSESAPASSGVPVNEVTLQWNASLSTDIGTEFPVPYEILIAYSALGPPTTIPEGQVLVRTRNVNSIVHKNVEGLWAYYTMFVHYLSQNDNYYEPVSYLSVMLPNNYGITDDMYSHIPSWYQGLDQSDGNGDLYKFLAIFGRDADYIRTVLDYMMTMKDPKIAEVTELNKIARDLGVQLQFQDLGADRLRKLLDNIGAIRRTKGTITSIEKELSAITGSKVEVDEVNKLIKVHNQRCNLVMDPKFINGVQTGLDGGSPSSEANETFTFDVGDASTGWNESTGAWDDYPGGMQPNGYTDGYIFDGGSPSDSGTVAIAGSSKKWVGYIDPATGEYKVLETLNANVPVIAGDEFYFSVQSSVPGKDVQGSIKSVSLYTTGGISEGDLITSDSGYHDINGIYYWHLIIPDSINTYTNAVLSIVFDHLPEGSTNEIFYEDFTNILFERNYPGDYFDGDTTIGGWLTDELTSIRDFRWRNPLNPNDPVIANAFSVYSANYQKTKAIVKSLLSSIIPVTELVTSGVVYSNVPVTENLKYTIVYDYIPGF